MIEATQRPQAARRAAKAVGFVGCLFFPFLHFSSNDVI